MTEEQVTEKPKGVTKAERMDSLVKVLESRRTTIEAALPKVMSVDKMLTLAQWAVTGNPAILQCTTLSIIQSLTVAAQLGLNPTGVLGSAYIVPYKNKHTGKLEATLIPGYRGLMELAWRSGVVKKLEARLVRDGEMFKIEWGSKAYIEHVPYITIPEGVAVIGCYAIADLGDGRWHADYMDAGQLEAIRNRSRAKQSGPWVSDTEEMYRKTVVRRLCKYLPLSADMATALSMEDALDQGVTAPPVLGLPKEIAPEPTPIPEETVEAEDVPDEEPPDDVPDFVPPTPEEEDAAMEGKTAGQKLAEEIKKRNGKQGKLPIK